MNESSFTCNTCGLAFQEADFQREHMKTDWHRYNLKRRVAGLPPIPSDVFAEKMIQQRSAQLEPETKNSSRRQITKKDKKRMEKEKRREELRQQQGEPEARSRASSMTSGVSSFSLGKPVSSAYDSDAEDTPSRESSAVPTRDEEALIQEKLANMVKIPTNVSFIDGKSFDSVEENVEYMEKKYGLVIPEPKYLESLDGLIEYLNEKVGLGNCCLYCSYMGRSVEAVRAHMISKAHVKIPYETDEQRMELADFYDFSTSYKAPAGGDDGWENVSDDDFADEDADETVMMDVDEQETDNFERDVYVNGFELQLAPGVSAGHRSLQRYYKQRFPGFNGEKPERKAVKMIDMRAPGVSEKQAAKMIKNQWKEEKRAKFEVLKHDKYVNFQKHYRDQLLQ